MKLNKLLTDEVRSTFTPLTQDAEGELKGGFGSLLGTASPCDDDAANNCLCPDNNCNCSSRQQSDPKNNCNCKNGEDPYQPLVGGNNCKCAGGVNNCSCNGTSTKSSNGLFLPALF